MANNDYCGIVFIAGGSSWTYAATPEQAAQRAAKQCKRDWKTLFKFEKRHKFTVTVLDMRKHDGWRADHTGIWSTGKKPQRIEPMQIVEVIV